MTRQAQTGPSLRDSRTHNTMSAATSYLADASVRCPNHGHRRVRARLAASLAGAILLCLPIIQAHADEITRQTEYEYHPSTGLLTLERVDPGGTHCVETRYQHDAYGNRQQVTVQPCATTAASAQFTPRVTYNDFEASADPNNAYPAGAYQTRTRTGAAGAYLSEARASYDPRFGSASVQTEVAQADASRNISKRVEYDGFGRVWREHAPVKRNADGSVVEAYVQHDHVYCLGSNAPTPSQPCLNFTEQVQVSYPTQRLVDSATGNPTSTAQIPFVTAYYVESTPYSGSTVIGAKARVHYDSLHREIAKEAQNYDGSWSRTLTGYDQLGNQAAAWSTHVGRTAAGVSQSPPAEFRQWSVARDLLHRAVEQRRYARLNETAAVVEMRALVTYKGLESIATVPSDSTPDGSTRNVITRKNGAGQTAQTENADGATLTMAYDPVGNLVKTVDALGNTTTVTYTAGTARFKTGMVDPDQGTWAYSYDALGQLLTQTDARLKTVTMTYDGLGRLATKSTPALTATWFYDKTEAGAWCASGLNRLCESKTGVAVTASRQALSYDSLGRSFRTVTTLDKAYTSEASFDDLGRVSTTRYPTGFTVQYGYSDTASGRTPGVLEKVFDAASTSRVFWNINSIAAGQVFDARGNLLKAQYGNGVVTDNRYDPISGKAFGLFAANGGGNNVLAHIYEYDKADNLARRTDSNTGVVDTFLYDILDRMKSYAVSSTLDLGATRTITLRYNALGNILDKSDVGGYSYTPNDRPHAVRTAGGTTYLYDANGNISSTTGVQSRTHSWTDFNLPDTLSYQGKSVAFGYDASYKRVKETTTDGATVRTLYLIHPDNAGGLGFEREETRVNGVLTRNESRHYISAGGGTIAVVKTLDEAGAVSSDPSLTNYWHKDALGSIVAVTNASSSGTVIERMAFDAWGRRLQPTGRVDPSLNPANGNRGYTGHEHLDELGLVHMNGRVYDATLARFMSPDSVVQSPGNLQNYDRYAYAWNNPLRYTDPSGQFIDPVSLSAFAFVIGTALSQMGNQYWSMAGAVMMAVAAPNLVEAGLGTNTAFSCGVSTFNVGGLANSFVAASGTSLIVSGGDVGKALQDGVFAMAFTAAGGVGESLSPERLALHSLIGCVQGAVGGGQCGPSALAAFAGKATTGAIPPDGVDNVTRGVLATLAGGTASVVGGGKFANGAYQAAFAYLFNAATRRGGAMIRSLRGESLEIRGEFLEASIRTLEPSSVPSSIGVPGGARYTEGYVRALETTFREVLTRAAERGVDGAWANFRDAIQNGRPHPSRQWLTFQTANELVRTGRIQGWEGHHQLEVSTFPSAAANPAYVSVMPAPVHRAITTFINYRDGPQ